MNIRECHQFSCVFPPVILLIEPRPILTPAAHFNNPTKAKIDLRHYNKNHFAGNLQTHNYVSFFCTDQHRKSKKNTEKPQKNANF
jgi:hypothetical protein